MIIDNISLVNFRNIENLKLNPHKKLNYFVGDNAQGKTNIIESIHYSSFLKSYRNNNSINLIKDDKNNFFINLKVSKNNITDDLKIYFDRKKNKSVKLNNKTPDNNDFFNKLKTIIYFPDEISYLTLYPQYRRNFIDRSIFLMDIDYVNNFMKYKKILKNRNNLIKNNSYNEMLDDVWIVSLVEEAVKIISKRKKYIDNINIIMEENNIYNENYKIEYNNYDFSDLHSYLIKKIKKNSEKDLKLGYTSIGPHTDDFIFKINSNDIRKYSSEGQKKSFLLKLKKSQLSNYFAINNDFPVLILDDVSNELDRHRKISYISDLIDNSGQVFITTTDITDKCDTNCSVFKVANGNVTY